MPSTPSKDYWCKAENRLKHQINLGWAIAGLRRALVGAALVWGSVNLIARQQQLAHRGEVITGVSLSLCLAMALYAAWVIRKRGITQAQARIRLEQSLHLNSALSTASEVPNAVYPPIPQKEPDLHLKWRLKPLLISLFWSLAIVSISQWLPITMSRAKESYQIEKPQAIRELESNLEKLKEEGALSEESVEEVQKKIDELLSKRAEEQWFESSTMEAADHVREQLQQELKNLAAKLDEAKESLAQESKDSAKGEEAQQKLMEAMEALKKNGLQPGSELSELAQQAMHQLGSLSEAQQKQLQDALEKNAQSLQEALQNSPQFGKGKGNGDSILEEGGEGDDSKNEDGGPGEGGVQRGKGDAPMVLKKDESETDAAALQSVGSRLDLERLAAGSAIEEKPYKPHPDEFKKPVPLEQHGGGARAGEVGSSSPVSPSFLPKEKAFLREVLK